MIFAPRDVGDLEADQLRIASDSAEPNRLLGQLWRAGKASGDVRDFGDRRHPSIVARKGWGAFQLASAVTADAAGDSVFGRSLSSHTSEPGLAREKCDSMGPQAKLRKAPESDFSLEQIAKFAQVGGQLDMLRNCYSGFRPAFSGMR